MPVRRALAAVLALPVLASIYLPLLFRRGPASRIGVTLVGGLAILVVAASLPAGTIGVPKATQEPLQAAALGPAVAASRELQAAAIVDFDAPMDEASVAAATRVDPPAEVALSWSADGRRLTVSPRVAWRAYTLYTVTVGTGARDRDGRALGTPVRSAFLTRALTSGRLAATDTRKSRVALDSSVVLSFDRPVSVADVVRSFRISPSVPGRVLVAADGADIDDAAMADNFVWEPADSYDGNTRYRVELAGAIRDIEGSPVAVPDPVTFRTTTAPSVVRFRPRGSTEDVARSQVVSVRFTRTMDRASTAKAFSVEVNGTKVAGTVDFAERDRVLVFDPKTSFPYGARVVLRVAPSALAADGTALDRGRSVSFTVVPKPKPKPKPAAAPRPAATTRGGSTTTTRPRSTTSRPQSSTWLAAEKYLLTLMNRERARVGAGALSYHAGLSDQVARPYARKLVIANVCSHFYGNTISDRLRAAGYTGSNWGENLGCRYFADPRDAAESLVRFFLGSPHHYANMVNRGYDYAGIGLWVASGRLRFVVVFYTP